MALAELTLFGGFELREVGGEVIDLPGQKDRALLAVLALCPGAIQSRDKLAGLLWSERGEPQARDSLKHALTRLRQCLPSATSPPIAADRQSVRLDPASLTVDVCRFEQLLGDGTTDALERAMALYRGDLLDGVGIHDPSFEDWLAGERQRLRHLAEEALGKLMSLSMAAGARDRAATAARRLLSLDPLREAACRTLMQIDADQARTAQALKLYETLRDRLHRELGVKPEVETVQLYELIRRRRAAATSPAAGPSPGEPAGRPEPMPVDLPLPSKPSIAVLPFANLSNDPDQDYFADGMVEDIITALSHFPRLFVIARNSSFTYKGRPGIDVRQVGRELGVRYVLEGSVRRAGERVRIAGQLIDASNGAHLWADRFDGVLADIFDLQDTVARSVVGAIEPRLMAAEVERAQRKRAASLDAYDLYLRALPHHYALTRDGSDAALTLLAQALAIDPDYAVAAGLAAWCYTLRTVQHRQTEPETEKRTGIELGHRAIARGPNDPDALAMGGYAIAFLGEELRAGLSAIERAITLNPNSAQALTHAGWVHGYLGEAAIAVTMFERSMRLSPRDLTMFRTYGGLSYANLLQERFEDAVLWARRSLDENPNYTPSLRLQAAALGHLARVGEAHAVIARLRALVPDETITSIAAWSTSLAAWSKKPGGGLLPLVLEGLRKAGLPE
jgi:TolB-like protein/DNA-binding SARP family transcriptional activator